MKFNWQNYKLKVKGEYLAEDITVELVDYKRKSNNFIDKAIEEVWRDTEKGRKSVGLELWDSTIYSLDSLQASEEEIQLKIGESTYKELQGTNATHWIFGDIYGRRFLSNGILVQSVLLMQGGKIVLGARNTGVKSGLESLAIFGGTLDKDENIISSSQDIFNSAKCEIYEEVGLDKEDLDSFKLVAIFEDWKYYPVFLFVAQTSLVESELLSKFRKLASSEHSRLVVLDKEVLEERISIAAERFSDLTLVALDILGLSFDC